MLYTLFSSKTILFSIVSFSFKSTSNNILYERKKTKIFIRNLKNSIYNKIHIFVCFSLDSTANSTWHHWLKTPLNKEDTPLPALWYLSLGAVLVGVIVSYSVARTINKASNIVHDNLVKSFFQAPITLLDQQLLSKSFLLISLYVYTT